MEQKRNWGNGFGIAALVFGIIALVLGVLSLIPLAGLYLAVVTGVLAIITISLGIPGVIGSARKNRPVVALVFGGTMLVWAVVRYFWVLAVLASMAAGA